MTWHWQSTCSACRFVSGQIGGNTPCPAHAGVWVRPSGLAELSRADAAPSIKPTADQPWPFSRLQYARLMLLRGRVRDHLREAPPCTPGRGGVHSIYEACMSDDMRAVLFGGAALLLFLLLFAFGQFQEIFRATGYH